MNDNYIIAEIYIKEEDINKNIRIISSFEKYKRTNHWVEYNSKDYGNEKELKNKCQIKINDEEISFNYYFKFKEKGKYN